MVLCCDCCTVDGPLAKVRGGVATETQTFRPKCVCDNDILSVLKVFILQTVPSPEAFPPSPASIQLFLPADTKHTPCPVVER